MPEPMITCPKCRSDIPLTESLAAPLLAATRVDYERKIAAKDVDVAAREAALRDEQQALERARADIEQQVLAKVQAERERIAAEEAAKVKRKTAAELEQKNKELAELNELLKARDEKLAEAQQAQANVIRQQRELDDAKRELELTIEKRVQASLATVRDKAKLEAEDALKLRVAEKKSRSLPCNARSTISNARQSRDHSSCRARSRNSPSKPRYGPGFLSI
jgi:hypothetical protein